MKTFKNVMKHVFYIEGADNVGKTTVINTLKRDEYLSKLKYKRIQFSKYPTCNATERINEMKRDIDDIGSSIAIKNIAVNELIKYMIADMGDSFVNLEAKQLINILQDYPSDILNICDRGFLSTYLYQYRGMMNTNLSITNEAELKYLKYFIDGYVPHYLGNDLNVIILNNNSSPLSSDLIIDESETIEYKKKFDHDVKLQLIINSSLEGITNLIEQGKLTELRGIKFYYIDIFKEDGTRKTPSEVCNEIVAIINKEE